MTQSVLTHMTPVRDLQRHATPRHESKHPAVASRDLIRNAASQQPHSLQRRLGSSLHPAYVTRSKQQFTQVNTVAMSTPCSKQCCPSAVAHARYTTKMRSKLQILRPRPLISPTLPTMAHEASYQIGKPPSPKHVLPCLEDHIQAPAGPQASYYCKTGLGTEPARRNSRRTAAPLTCMPVPWSPSSVPTCPTR